MTLIVLRKELALHVLTLRFLVGFLVCVSLVTIAAWISAIGHDQRVAQYRAGVAKAHEEVQQIEVYSDLACTHRLQVDRAPRPLAVFSEGVEGRLASRFAVAHSFGHGYAEGMRSGDPFTRIFSNYDVVTVLQVILSFLALLFAYDAISGEAETGTLALVLTHPGSRSLLLLGKYLGALVSLALPLACSFIAAIVVLRAVGHVELGGAEWIRVGLVLGLCLLYLSLFLLLGLWLSAVTRESATTLLWAAVLWVVLVLLYPTAVLFAVDRLRPLQPPDNPAQAAQELANSFRREAEAYLQQHGKKGPFDGFQGSGSMSSDDHGESVRETPANTNGVVDPRAERAMTFAQGYYAFAEPLRAHYADRAETLWREYLKGQLDGQAASAWRLLRLSPAGLLAEAASMAADTDRASYWRFVDQARRFRQGLIGYLENQGAFGSRRWFTTLDGKVETASLPHFAESPEGPGELLERLAWRIAALVGLNGLLYLAASLAFARRQIA